MKTRSNTAAAILSNTKDLEEALLAAQDAEGSALRENEKYLDSIQGKIDLFTNAVQTMWSNTLDDDLIKNIVEFGTTLVKLVDDVGLFKFALSGLLTYISTKYVGINWAHPIQSFKTLFGKPAVTSIEDMQKNLQKLQQTYDDAFAKWKADPTQETRQGVVDAKNNLGAYNQKLTNTIETTSALETAQKNLTNAQANLNNYKGNDPKQLYKYQNAVDRAQKKVDKLKVAQQETSKTGSTGWQKLGDKVSGFAQKVQSAIASMLVMYAISKAMQLISDLFDFAIETAEEAKETFEDLSADLSNTESELRSLESQLEDIQSQIKDINENAPLTFTEQEELSRLQSESIELQRQIDLMDKLREQQQQGVNASAVNASSKYAQTGVKTGKTTGENVGEKAGTGALIGAGAGSVVLAGVGTSLVSGMLTGTAAASWAGPIGMLIGAAIGAIVGGVGGAVTGGIQSASEETVGESLDNMKAQYEKLQLEYESARQKYMGNPDEDNKEEFEEAQKAIREYEANMSNYLLEMDAIYSQMDWKTATEEERQAMQDFYDTQDKWAIQSGGANAKTNAIARIFGENADENLKNIKSKIEDAVEEGEHFQLKDVLDEEEYSKLLNRLHSIGLGASDVTAYFRDMYQAEVEAMNDTSTENAVKEVANLTSGIKALKGAFDELRTEGKLSVDSLMGLKDIFGSTEGWDTFINTMSTGVATMDEMEGVTSALAENYIKDKITPDKWNPEEYLTYINNLESLGVTNARDFVNGLLQQAAIDGVLNGKFGDIDEAEDFYSSDNYKVDVPDELLEMAEIVQEAKTNATAVFDAKTAYDASMNNKETYLHYKQRADEIEREHFGMVNSEKYKQYIKKVNKMEEIERDGFNPSNAYEYSYLDSDVRSFERSDFYKHMQELEAEYFDIRGKLEEYSYDASLPVVTEADVESANKAAENAKTAYQDALNKYKLRLDIELIDVNDLIDDLQNVYDTLTSAAKEYAENGGYVSVDTLQALLGLEPKYIGLLYNEQGQLDLNTESIQRMTQARIMEAAILEVKSYLTNLENAAIAGNVGQLAALTEATSIATDTEWGFVDAKLATIQATMIANGVSADEAKKYTENARHNIESIKALATTTANNISNTISSSGNTAKAEAEDAFQKAMTYWENRIGANQAKYEQVQNEIDLLESQGKQAGAAYYQKQIELEKERRWLLQQQEAEAKRMLSTFTEGSDEWFRKKPAYWEINKRIPLNCWNFLRALYTTTQG